MSAVPNPRDVVSVARREDWSVVRLQAVFPSMSISTATKLLAGSAVISEVRADGSFTVYVPGVQEG